MSQQMPSMVALLGLLAVAGFQNRDKLGGLLGNLGGSTSGNGQTGDGGMGGLGGLLGGLGGLGSQSAGGGLGGLLGGAGVGSVLSGGLGGLLDHFQQAGTGGKAQSWVTDGPNEPIETHELERTLGADTIDTLVQQTGLSKEELLSRLSQTLPEAVNTLTPQGRVPTETEASQIASNQA